MDTLIIVGYGKMARALAFGLKDRFQLKICGRDDRKIETLCEEISRNTDTKVEPYFLKDNTIDINDSKVLLCVKPKAIGSFAYSGKATCVYSILNAVTLEMLRNCISSNYYVRAMPNVASEHRASLTSICGDIEAKEEAICLFESIGRCVWIDESSMPIATALGGCSPAFLAVIAEAFVDSGVAYGLSRDESREIVKGLFYGFSTLLDNAHPAHIKESVMSPGGSTAQGVLSLEKDAIRGIISDAIYKSKSFA